MNGSERALRVLSLAVAPARRPRFLEEWRADLLAARSLGLPPSTMLTAALRVALLLLWTQVRPALQRGRGRAELIVSGTVCGLLLTVVDAPLTGTVPFVVLAVTGWTWARVRAWVVGAP